MNFSFHFQGIHSMSGSLVSIRIRLVNLRIRIQREMCICNACEHHRTILGEIHQVVPHSEDHFFRERAVLNDPHIAPEVVLTEYRKPEVIRLMLIVERISNFAGKLSLAASMCIYQGRRTSVKRARSRDKENCAT